MICTPTSICLLPQLPGQQVYIDDDFVWRWDDLHSLWILCDEVQLADVGFFPDANNKYIGVSIT